MDRFFKIKRAQEEVKRLNIEIKWVVTHIADEEKHLQTMEHIVLQNDPVLAFHVGNYRLERTRFNTLHLRRFQQLAQLPGLTGDLTSGVPKDSALRDHGWSDNNPNAMSVDLRGDNEMQWRDDQDGEVLAGIYGDGDEQPDGHENEEDELEARLQVMTLVAD
jgi:hypothetical protein